MRRNPTLVLCALVGLSLGCGLTLEPTPSPFPQSKSTPTATATPEPTPSPSPQPEPTPTATPTRQPIPTPTLAPSIPPQSGPCDILMITTGLLRTSAELKAALGEYRDAVEATEGLVARYVELDSAECLRDYGVQVTNPADWQEIRETLRVILRTTGASYVMILGGTAVVPRPQVDACCEGESSVTVPSDAWYIDLDGDGIVDEGVSISRLPDLSHDSSAVVAGLQTATALHNAGGFTLDAEVRFTMNDCTTPPYGVCETCAQQAEFFDLVSANDLIVFAGHGSPIGIHSNDGAPKFTINFMDSVDLQAHHPVILTYYCCNTGVLWADEPTLSYEFIRGGAAAFVARTTTLGVPTHVADTFPEEIKGGARIGDALFTAMREAVLEYGGTFKAPAGHICLYGDPTLRRR